MRLAARSTRAEILDGTSVSEETRRRCYDDLSRMHRWLGNHAAIVKCLRRDRVRTVLDIGCAQGALLRELETRLGVNAIGVDLHPPERPLGGTIFRADAVRDPLPSADAAVSVVMAHHLSDEDLVRLIRNVGRTCRRLVILDSVRHWIPLLLFRGFVAPFVNSINVQDGILSLQRSFTSREMRSLVAKALHGSAARFRHTVAPLYTRQIVDIDYGDRLPFQR